MEPKDATKQFELKFDGETSCEVSGEYCVYPPCICASSENGTSTPAEVVSIADKIAEKEQEKDSKLFEGILSRDKHLEF